MEDNVITAVCVTFLIYCPPPHGGGRGGYWPTVILTYFFLVIFLLAFNNEVAQLLVAANELEMMNGEYAFITLDFTIESNWINEPWAGGRSPKDFGALFDGTINLSVKGPQGEHYEMFVRQFNETIKANNISELSIVSIVSSSQHFL